MLTPQVVAGPGAKVRLDCSAAQASTEPASAERRLPLTEPDRDMHMDMCMSCRLSAVKLVKWCRQAIAEVAPADVRARPDDQARELRTEAQITGGELTADTCWTAAEDAVQQ